MSRWHSYINSALTILDGYAGEEPFAAYLKKYFATNKKYGSKDRKQIAHLGYCYFRAGHALPDLPVEERILMALFLCSGEPDQLLANLRPEWNEKTLGGVKDKLRFLGLEESLHRFFPWIQELSEGVDAEAFSKSFLVQPDLFIRIRPGCLEKVKAKLDSAQVKYESLPDSCFSFPPGTRLEDWLETNREAVIQDYNSQRVGELLRLILQKEGPAIRTVWDCCAASGGKSMMASDILGNITLTVSDIRESILHNLEKRLAAAGIRHYKRIVADLSQKDPFPASEKFDLVIADVPCSGSGTWSRTPEQLYYFREEKITGYQQLQQRIVSTVLPHVKAGGYFLYITCSVFKKENEEMVNFITANPGYSIVKKEVLTGYDKKADTMFACLLRRKL
ncbi:MAG: Fmu (Sun) domain-containing protein [Sphingobacteriales bacterium]|nr:Fmu (Sun) domain-containing protein [Sphingobacteriales bacterium]